MAKGLRRLLGCDDEDTEISEIYDNHVTVTVLRSKQNRVNTQHNERLRHKRVTATVNRGPTISGVQLIRSN